LFYFVSYAEAFAACYGSKPDQQTGETIVVATPQRAGKVAAALLLLVCAFGDFILFVFGKADPP
jgi:hypothetical protein